MQDSETSRRHPSAPVVAVGGLLVEKGKLLLIRRGHEPSKGAWTLPGGGVRLGEPLREAVRREFLEETGLEVEPETVADAVDIIVREDGGVVAYHFVVVDYWVSRVGGSLRASSDASDVRWFRVDSLPEAEMPPGSYPAIVRMLRQRGYDVPG